MNRPPLGPVAFNSEINPPQEVPRWGSFPGALGAGAGMSVAVVGAAYPAAIAGTRAGLPAPGWLESLPLTSLLHREQ